MNILIRSTLKKHGPPAALIKGSLRILLRAERLHAAEVSVLLVGDRAMRTLNRRYRGKDRTTDVLSFPMREGRFPRVRQELLGDIVLCVPAAARQARSAGGTFRGEIDRLLVHGLLHLLGYDHERGEQEARRMDAHERRLREALER